MMRRLFAMAALLAGAHAVAAPCGPYNVSMYEHGALYYQSGGAWAGIDKDIVEELVRRTGCQLRMTRESRIRIWTMLKEGTLDITMSGIATPERETYARFTPYLQSRNMLVLRSDAASQVASLEQFLARPGLRVAVIKGFRHSPTYDAWLDKLRQQGRVHETPDYSTLLRLFQHGRVHAILQLASNIDMLPRDGIAREQFHVMDWAPRDNVVGAMVISRLVPSEAASKLEQALHAMREDGTLKAIMERHTSAERAAAMLIPSAR